VNEAEGAHGSALIILTNPELQRGRLGECGGGANLPGRTFPGRFNGAASAYEAEHAGAGMVIVF